MTAKLTITLGQDVLKALRASKAIKIAIQSGGGSAAAAAAPAVRSATAGGGKNSRGAFREGSLPAKLLQWSKGRKQPFGVQDVMKKLKIKRGHASMLIAYATKAGAVKRVGRGAYVAA